MAAVFLHNAIFAAEPPTPPPPSLSSHAHSHRGGPFLLSHPTEPLLRPNSFADSASSVYLGLLARQPTHPDAPTVGMGLTLQGDPLTMREKRVQRERAVRKLLRRLRWAKRALWALIGSWATYCTVRYYVGAWLHPFQTRQIIALVLGSCTALCLACNVTSLVISAFAHRLGWYYRPHSKHELLQGFLRYSSSLLLIAPSIVNFVLVILWRNISDIKDSLQGRCHWDIDVVWSGFGGVCDDSPAFGFWLVGAIVRLLLTLALVLAYHVVSYKYMVTRRPSRRRHSTLVRHSTASSRPSTVGTTMSTHSSRREGSPRHDRRGLVPEGEPHALLSVRSRILGAEVNPAGPSQVVRRAERQSSSSPTPPSSPSTSERGSSDDEEHYGRPIQRSWGGYASVPDDGSPDRDSALEQHWQPTSRTSRGIPCRTQTEQLRGTVPGAGRAGRDRDEYGAPRDSQYVLGRASMGSHELVSLASASAYGGFSRPLSLSVDGLAALAAAGGSDSRGASEFGELTPSSATSYSSPAFFGGRREQEYGVVPHRD
ncbi:uncharacterized protein BXZ73DRAFT_91857 [Epithele typhae]|uniref:uncharacterized protein n=1 Tax=Epithele typhae TaxID=378194 RepID=UPI0020083145|nr:uncharacterized protein BXZ73DRAFT_91857 [Epithele typhae]KAH9920823.1 hypothetical protein BXZ73DRAFT_91857 [Epithele typhae]